MKKMQPGDYILKKNITDEETYNRIRDCVKKMGYPVSSMYGVWRANASPIRDKLLLDRDGDLMWSHNEGSGHEFTPQQIFAMVEDDEMKEDIKQTIQRMEQEIATLKEKLDKQEVKIDAPTYQRGQRFYIGGSRDGEYILACVGGEEEMFDLCLVGIESGNRYTDHKKVKDCRNVTVNEMLTLTNGTLFKLIEK